ncbi:hypothetical protein OROGR_033126 [Orobanche gracilis]
MALNQHQREELSETMQMFYATWNNANEGRLFYGDDSIQALVAHIGYIHQFGFGPFVPFQHNQGLILAMQEGAMMHEHPWRYHLYSSVIFQLDLWLEIWEENGGGIGPQQLNMIAIYNFLIGQQLTHIIAAIAAGNAAVGNVAADVGAAGVGGEAAAGGGEAVAGGGEAAGVGGEAVVEEIDDDAPEKSKSTTESSKSKSTTDAEDEAGPSKKRRLLPSKEIP